MSKDDNLIIYRKDGTNYKICRVFFGRDGSYYVTSPYHPLNRAVLLKYTTTYGPYGVAKFVDDGDVVEFASLHDDEKRLKLAHHPDGLIQFSGEGVMSGKDEEGNPKGIGVQSWLLNNPAPGPAFAISLLGLDQFQQVTSFKDSPCIFKDEDIPPDKESNGLMLEGFYFQSNFRRFIQFEHDGTHILLIAHPTGCVLKLRVLLPLESCELQGFIGVTLYRHEISFDRESGVKVAFILSSSTGNLRRNAMGETIADALSCCYPQTKGMPVRRNVNYPSRPIS
jgi:hypothetical protein